MRRFIQSLFPPGERERVETPISKMGSAMGGYIRGSVLNGVIVGLGY
jgi:predicted PurR-regulated permease PerM